MNSTNRRLMFNGMLLFLIGLFTGFAEQHFANIRMGLAAHLEGVMNGTFLLALGAAWPEIRLSRRTEQIAFRTVLFATYANWGTTTLAAVFGTRALSPITGGEGGAPWQEILINAGFITVGIAVVAAAVMLVWGFRAKAEQPAAGSGDVVSMRAAGSKRA